MFKVKNGTGAALALGLEKGSTILHIGGSLDLDGICSRRWLRLDPILQRLLSSGALVLIFDSEVSVPKPPVNDIVGSDKKLLPPRYKKVVEDPIIIDFNDLEDTEEETIPDVAVLMDDPLEDDAKDDVEEEFSFDLEELEDTNVSEEVEKETKQHLCKKCGKVCKSLTGLVSHMRAHKDE